jgi:hypothetical protein
VSRLKDIVVDCRDAWTLAHWWAETLGYRVRPHTEEDRAQLRAEGIERPEDDPNIAVDPDGEPGPGFFFCAVPEPKVGKTRIHLDVYGDVEDLVRRGATVLDSTLPRWTVLADPEGNEFCVFPPP